MILQALSPAMSVAEERRGNVVVLTLRQPPLNPLSHPLRAGIVEALQRAQGDAGVRSVVMIGHGGNFSAGADIKEMAGGGGINLEPLLPEVCDAIEQCTKPVIACVDGVAFGGGCELVLSCHYRVVTPRAKLGLPEVKIGLIPGAGGTQRLPRLVSAPVAMKMIQTGAPLSGSKALAEGLADHVVESGDLLEGAMAFLQSGRAGVPRVTSSAPLKDSPATIKAVAQKARESLKRGGLAEIACTEALAAAATGSFDEGMAKEGELFANLIVGEESTALRYIFLAERATTRLGPKPPHVPEVTSVGVVGAGTMGSGIALAHMFAGIPVVLVDVKEEALNRGVANIKRSIAGAVKRGFVKKHQAAMLESLLTTSKELADLKDVDMVVEAVFENMALKRKIFGMLDKICHADAVLCTNTSTLNVDSIAQATERPQSVLGMHFFSPAHIMPLVEVVRGAASSPGIITAVMKVVKQMRKIGVLVGNCDGFVGNRMMLPYLTEVMFLLEEGASQRQIDGALRGFGFKIGPLEMSDLAGNDISWLIRKERGYLDPVKRQKLLGGQRYSSLPDKLCEMGRFGQKVGKGWYQYEKKSFKPMDDPAVEALLSDHRRELGLEKATFSDEEIVDRCLLPLVNEGYKILQEGFARNPADIDVIWVHGYAWPRWRGGPMLWAKQRGLATIVRKMQQLERQHPSVRHWTPAKLLLDQAQAGGVPRL